VARGYAIVRDEQGAVVKSVIGVRRGDQLKAQVGDGEIVFAVTNTTALTLNGERQS
jgi:exonuclease VII large subunit